MRAESLSERVSGRRRQIVAGLLATAALAGITQPANSRPAKPDSVSSSQELCVVDAGPCFKERIEEWRKGRTIVIRMAAKNVIEHCGATITDSARARVVVRKPDDPVTPEGVERISGRMRDSLTERVAIQDGELPPCAVDIGTPDFGPSSDQLQAVQPLVVQG